MQLFRKEVYQKLQDTSSLERGVEEALTQIVNDTNLQAAIRNYARRNEISHKGEGEYGSGLSEEEALCLDDYTFKDRKIVFWSKEENSLYIGPDPNKKIMPIYLRTKGLKRVSDHVVMEFDYCDVYYNLAIKQRKPGKFYLENGKNSSLDEMEGEVIPGQRIIDIPFLQGISARLFLDGLEKAIAKIIGE